MKKPISKIVLARLPLLALLVLGACTTAPVPSRGGEPSPVAATPYEIGKLIDAELEHVLPNVQRVIVPDATHETCNEQPAFCAETIRSFLMKQAPR